MMFRITLCILPLSTQEAREQYRGRRGGGREERGKGKGKKKKKFSPPNRYPASEPKRKINKYNRKTLVKLEGSERDSKKGQRGEKTEGKTKKRKMHNAWALSLSLAPGLKYFCSTITLTPRSQKESCRGKRRSEMEGEKGAQERQGRKITLPHRHPLSEYHTGFFPDQG